jgi:hypothetical protein
MKPILYTAVLLFALTGWQVRAAELSISLSTPLARAGDTIQHNSSSLKIKGEILGTDAVEEVEINGQSAALGARDLVVEELQEGIPFQGLALLRAGDNAVEIIARATDGTKAVLRFTVQVEAADLQGSAYALIVGVNDYQDARISDLRYAEADAQAVKEALSHPQYGVVPPENIRVLNGAEATYRNISLALEEHLVRQATKPEDVVFFYFAGHGAEGAHMSRGAAYYLVPHDADVRNLLSTAIEKGRLQFLWGAVGATRKVFITDACHSGGLQDMKVLTASGFEAVEGFITLAAARADQRSWELPRLGHGIFTYALTQGLQGGADREGGNADGFVSALELGNYLEAQVGKMAAEVGAEQAPIVDLVPGAQEILLGTSAGQPLPLWTVTAAPTVAAVGGPIQVSLHFREKDQKPRVVVAVRDEGGDKDLGQVVGTAIMGRFLEVSEIFRFVEQGAISAALQEEQAELAFSEAPGELAAVARAVAADLILTGAVKSEVSGDAATELLGTAMQSFQAHLNMRVVYANSGEVIQAISVQKPGMHINPEMARRQALEKAGAELADQLMGPMLERWSELRRERPSGRLTIKNLADYEVLQALEEGLENLQPAVRELNWRSFVDGTAVYEFDSSAKPQEVVELLEQKGVPGFKIGRVKATKSRLSFVVSQ